jgi:hypothetical protein
LWIEHPNLAGQSLVTADRHTFRQLSESFVCRNPFDLHPVTAVVGMPRVQKTIDQRALVAQQQQPFAFGIEPTHRVDTARESELFQRPPTRAILSELRDYSIGLVESDEHR